ncbi:putative RNA-directed DNA polymerase [Lupinus albus]|uniref:Putative RNA-directed DNA polymerase n=1 Tax=Lupinus albus TaxID=3870 RepID=A0A6A4NJB1_LUPAL|nr:putative RNA-directed DNA polymerase [Lupinus albus]
MSVLVNGSPATNFYVSRSIRQGDPMAPFMFLMVAEGFAGLVRKARSIGVLEGYKIGGGGVEVCDLQFANDTIIVCKPSDRNLMCLKSILRCFELASGLKVNSNKSFLYGIRLSDSIISAAANFLFCKIGFFPFNYLGVPVGANPRRISTWQLMIEIISKRLASWKCKHISFGGRLILLNSVLSNIPTYMLSLYKAPKKVYCVSGLGLVCKPKELGGLGVKDLIHFNHALLGKWRWRRLQDKEAFWVQVIDSKYGSEWSFQRSGIASRWCKDIGKVGSPDADTSGWFDGNVWKEIGNGLQTLFWHDVWVGNQSLKMVFPRLFRLAVDQNSWVGDNGFWRDDVWIWKILWRRNLFGRNESLA